MIRYWLYGKLSLDLTKMPVSCGERRSLMPRHRHSVSGHSANTMKFLPNFFEKGQVHIIAL